MPSGDLKVGTLRIKYSGIFDVNELFEFMHSWFASYNYDSFLKKHSEEKKGNGYFIDYEWAAERKISDYINFTVSSVLSISKANPVIVVENGEKIKRFKGNIFIEMSAKANRDPYNKFGKLQFMGHIYDKYFLDEEGIKKKLGGELKDYHKGIKVLLGITK